MDYLEEAGIYISWLLLIYKEIIFKNRYSLCLLRASVLKEVVKGIEIGDKLTIMERRACYINKIYI